MRLETASVLPLLLVAACFTPNQMTETTETAASEAGSGSSSGGNEVGSSGTPATTTSSGTTTADPGEEGSASVTTNGESETSDTTTSDTTVDDTTTDDTTTGGEDDTTGQACAEDCVVLPEGWNGPVSLAEGDVPPACQDASEPEFVGYSGLNAPAAACDCDCGESDISCPETGTISNRGTPDQFACFVFVSPTWTSDVGPGCNNIPDVLDPAAELRLVVDGPTNPDAASCSPSATTDVPPATWSNGWTGCSVEAAVDSCELCLTEAEDLCIWSDGDVACNVPGFPDKTLMFDGITDGRDCSECSCGDPSGSCDATVTYRASDTCGLANVGSGQDGECIDAAYARGAALVFETDFACAPSPVNAVGTADGANPRTVCCEG